MLYNLYFFLVKKKVKSKLAKLAKKKIFRRNKKIHKTYAKIYRTIALTHKKYIKNKL